MHLIETPTLTLEPQIAAHAPEMFAVLCDPAIYEFENEPPPSVEWLRARYAKLAARRSPDGMEHWLNWVIRLPSSEAIGYVQATVHLGGHAGIAYELSSKFWGRGFATEAVQAVLIELRENYRVHHVRAVLKVANWRSMRLLNRSGFRLASPEEHAKLEVQAGEALMQLALDSLQ